MNPALLQKRRLQTSRAALPRENESIAISSVAPNEGTKMDEQKPEETPAEREETLKDLDVPEEESKDVKGGDWIKNEPNK